MMMRLGAAAVQGGPYYAAGPDLVCAAALLNIRNDDTCMMMINGWMDDRGKCRREQWYDDLRRALPRRRCACCRTAHAPLPPAADRSPDTLRAQGSGPTHRN